MIAPAARMDRTAPAPRVRRASILFRQREQEHPVVGLIGYYRQVRKGLDGRCKFRCGADTESCLGCKGLRIHNRNRVAQRIDREDRAGLAALFFNLTLMTSVEMLAATPDMPSLVASSAFVYFLARVQAGNDGRFWLGAGIAAGLGLLAKFSALFLGVGALVWLMVDRDARKWLLSPWPYLGAILALAIFAPNLLWQSQHHWQTFGEQFNPAFAVTANGAISLPTLPFSERMIIAQSE